MRKSKDQRQEVAESPWRFLVLSEYRKIWLKMAENLKIRIILLLLNRLFSGPKCMTLVALLKKVAASPNGSCSRDWRMSVV